MKKNLALPSASNCAEALEKYKISLSDSLSELRLDENVLVKLRSFINNRVDIMTTPSDILLLYALFF